MKFLCLVILAFTAVCAQDALSYEGGVNYADEGAMDMPQMPEMAFQQVDAEAEAMPAAKKAVAPKAPAAAKPLKKPVVTPRAIPAAPKAATKPWKYHPERNVQSVPANVKGDYPEMFKLNQALEAVKEDILSTNKQIGDERKWVIAVNKIIVSYTEKMKRVEDHIIALRKEMKNLYKKKKQIENLKLQKALEAKLKEALDELATLTNSLKHVQTKQGELNKSGSELRATIAGIKAQLAKLRGQTKPKAPVKAKSKAKAKAKGKGKGKGKGKAGKNKKNKKVKNTKRRF
uniref:Uncharacterized protein n=1 Tax=Meloidogyne graminicola TaxID=189291 RepID=A0A2R4SDE7_9BILA|nr:hypothetical protein [Meloidogyne graminicola]